MSAIEDKVRKMLSEDLKLEEEEVTLSAELVKDLRADSYYMAVLAPGLEYDFGISITDEEVNNFRTVGDIVNLIKAKGYVSPEEIEAAKVEAERQRTEKIPEIKRKAKDIIKKELGVEEAKVTSTALISDLGADPLDYIEVIHELDKEFNIEITEDEAAKAKTVGDLLQIIIKKNPT